MDFQQNFTIDKTATTETGFIQVDLSIRAKNTAMPEGVAEAVRDFELKISELLLNPKN